MKQADLGTDLYNGTITGGVAASLTAAQAIKNASGPSVLTTYLEQPSGGVIALEGNGARPSHQGNGWNDKCVMFTLNAVEQHSVLTTFSCQEAQHSKAEDGMTK